MRRNYAALLNSSRNRGRPLTLYWVSDTHISVLDDQPEDPGAISSGLHLYTGLAKLNQFVEDANAGADFVLHTGDCVHFNEPELASFASAWANLTVPNALMIGNHDLYADSYADVTVALGYDGQPEVAGSKFNQSIAISGGDAAVRLLMLDTQVTESGHTGGIYEGTIRDEAITWLEDELTDCPEDIAIIASHHGPHETTGGEDSSFVPAEAAAVIAAVEGVIAARPGLKVAWFYGHEHGTKLVLRSSRFGTKVRGYLCPALIDGNPGYYSVVSVYPDGSLRFQQKSRAYPEP